MDWNKRSLELLSRFSSNIIIHDADTPRDDSENREGQGIFILNRILGDVYWKCDKLGNSGPEIENF